MAASLKALWIFNTSPHRSKKVRAEFFLSLSFLPFLIKQSASLFPTWNFPHKTYQFSSWALRPRRQWRWRSGNKERTVQISTWSFKPLNPNDCGWSCVSGHTNDFNSVSKACLPSTRPVWLASIHMSFMQWKTHRVKQPRALIKALCPVFHSLHGNSAAAPKHPRHRTKQEADCPPPRTPHSCIPSPSWAPPPHTHPPLFAGPAASLQHVGAIKGWWTWKPTKATFCVPTQESNHETARAC